MTEETVREVFSDYIEGDSLRVDDFVHVEIETFLLFFGSVSDPYSYTEYAALDQGKKGYMPFFDRCKAEGILT